MFDNVVANVAVAAHFGLLALGILGGFLAWRWRWRWGLWLQVVAAARLVLVVAAHLPCPLTGDEDRARERDGPSRTQAASWTATWPGSSIRTATNARPRSSPPRSCSARGPAWP